MNEDLLLESRMGGDRSRGKEREWIAGRKRELMKIPMSQCAFWALILKAIAFKARQGLYRGRTINVGLQNSFSFHISFHTPPVYFSTPNHSDPKRLGIAPNCLTK